MTENHKESLMRTYRFPKMSKDIQEKSPLSELWPVGLIFATRFPYLGGKSIEMAIFLISIIVALFNLGGLWLIGEKRFLVCGLAALYTSLIGQIGIYKGWKDTQQQYNTIKRMFVDSAAAEAFDSILVGAMNIRKQLRK
jgi:hypothetical protein